jgi:hypothetical protein
MLLRVTLLAGIAAVMLSGFAQAADVNGLVGRGLAGAIAGGIGGSGGSGGHGHGHGNSGLVGGPGVDDHNLNSNVTAGAGNGAIRGTPPRR